jgi:cytoskeletal protein CcmA (bactofilin family)
MFKKTEETEWTRFSKALSGRERDEAEPAPEAEATQQQGPVAPSSSLLRQPTVESATAQQSAGRAADLQDDVESVVGEHTTIDGTFKSESSIRIHGTVQGEVESKRSILIEAEANVTAKVTAETVTISGQVNGQIYCSGRVEIKPSGRVVGEINAGTLIMEEGAFFEGNLKMGGRSGQASSVETAAAVAP